MSDVLIAGVITVFVLSWLIPVVGILIMLESRGPFFFIQKRSGRRAVPFACFKFRTMRHAQPRSGFRQTEREDARVTRLGRFLRKTNLDEMPQFLNVLMGDMSLVGPRPHAIPHDAMHWSETAYRERYWAKPGITGLAQVRGSRGATGMTQRMDHRVRYDHVYIPRQTFLLDMKICMRTVGLMFTGDKNAW
ncbi:sugar transferase [Spirosoma agri]|uniref:Sugar transferase n=2 Tax=Spirosoma agri TaxID=1987381 RepID=A0A6M0IGY2_9BACT|nr:sugar transferase [Spirosoma agri]